jgi:hypothetical protein
MPKHESDVVPVTRDQDALISHGLREYLDVADPARLQDNGADVVASLHEHPCHRRTEVLVE